MGASRKRSVLDTARLLWGLRASWCAVAAASSTPAAQEIPAKIAAAAVAAASSTNETIGDPHTCTMWIAPSTIPGAGLGIYAGKDFGLWEPIGSPDLVIPIVDYHQHHPEHDDEIIFDFYGWNVWSFAHADVEGLDDDETIAFCPGAGAALNCMLGLVNTVAEDDKVSMDQAGLHRSKDPGAGAFTPFHNRQLISRGGVRAGDELFDSYGEAYFADREAVFGKIPLPADHEQADELLSSYVDVKASICQQTGPSACGSIHSDWYGLLVSLKSLWPSRVLNALPTDSEKVDEILDAGTAYIHYDRSQRPLEWLAENGMCMDYLQIQQSNIPQAGRGAFARRNMKAGTVVGPAPAIHVPRALLSMRPTEYKSGRPEIDADAHPNHHQLILNYCWGHRHTSVVLCPYGSVTSTINHSRKAANVRLQWNTKLTQHPEWLRMPVSEWVSDMHAGLMLDFVATRDIHEGEEILIDYGEEWEAAWNSHVQSWTPPKRADTYVDAVHRNEQEHVLRTVREGHYDETYTRLHCRDVYRVWSGLGVDDPDLDDDGESDKKLHPCRVILRSHCTADDCIYAAEITEAVVTERMTEIRVKEVLFAVGRDAFVFVDEALERDHSQPWAFRHDARIPDDIFPAVWKDLLPK